jgi:hypothetical protein
MVMPKTSKTKLAYQADRQKTPAEVEKRVARNKARRHAIAEGKASVGDNTQVDHIKPLSKGGSTKDSNTRVVSTAKNEGWRKEYPEMYGKAKSKKK